MKRKVLAYEIIDHGYDHSQYFQGCGTSFTDFNHVFTGCGNDAKAAYEDALDSAYQTIGDAADKLPRRPRGIRKKDHVPVTLTKDEMSEYYWYVSIRVKTI